MKFAEKLKKAMQELNLNQRQVVTMTGKSKGSKFFCRERGQVKAAQRTSPERTPASFPLNPQLRQ